MKYYVSEINLKTGRVKHYLPLPLEVSRRMVEVFQEIEKEWNAKIKYVISSETIKKSETEYYLTKSYFRHEPIVRHSANPDKEQISFYQSRIQELKEKHREQLENYANELSKARSKNNLYHNITAGIVFGILFTGTLILLL